ncbi:circadian clock protein PASD1 [Antechinus flavipes]|uniref:circadian clock protein PASD1 n=1 Tax=Antechinus flavipes TaxID=38775 RepID=UPI00223576F4|nr:circadian clock protein PASD1 [Antechinus flavipes]
MRVCKALTYTNFMRPPSGLDVMLRITGNHKELSHRDGGEELDKGQRLQTLSLPNMAQSGEQAELADLLEAGPSTCREIKLPEPSCSKEVMDEKEKERLKRASRNKSEKKRRDQFNVLIRELCTLLQEEGRPIKMDKATILQKTIDFFHQHKEKETQTHAANARKAWKPPFLTNNEFTQLMFEALDEFLIVLTTEGIIIYISDNISPLLGHLPSELVHQNILTLLPEQEHKEVFKVLSPQTILPTPVSTDFLNEKQIEFSCHLARRRMNPNEPVVYEFVKFFVDFKYLSHVPIPSCSDFESTVAKVFGSPADDPLCLVATVRLCSPQLLKEVVTGDDAGEEFASRHSLEWKFLFLDHRAPPIIGYLPFEVLGTSGYDYYHVDDLESLAKCHEQLMQFGKGKSCYYRFLTKGQQWIWLQTHYYISYHQWNSKPQFIVCTHTVVSYARIEAERRKKLAFEEPSATETALVPFESSNSFMDVSQSGNSLDVTTESASGSSHSILHSSSFPLQSNSTSTLLVQSKKISKTLMRWDQQPAKTFDKTFLGEAASSSSSSSSSNNNSSSSSNNSSSSSSCPEMLLQPPTSLNFKSPKPLKSKKGSHRRARVPKTATKCQSDFLEPESYGSSSIPSDQFLEEPCITPSLQQQQLQQQQQEQNLINENEELCIPDDTSISMPLYGDPMLFSETYSITVSAEVPIDIIQQPLDCDQDITLGFLQDDQLLPAPSAFAPMFIPTTDLAILDPQQLPVHQWQEPQVPESDVCVQIHTPEAVQGSQTSGLFQAPQLLQSPSMGCFLQSQQPNAEM